MPPGNAADRLHRRIDIGRLGVVVVVDAIDRRDKLEAMLDRMEAFTALRIAAASTPASRAAHTAASTFSTLCAPLSGISRNLQHRLRLRPAPTRA